MDDAKPTAGLPALVGARAGRGDAIASSLPPLEAGVHGPRGLALAVHRHLRQHILDGALPPGAVLNQAVLARALGVSRTPMREAFRMLQEEGLIHAEPDRRAVVTGLDLADLDAMYGSRIMLEALAVRMTVATASPVAVAALQDALGRMYELREERQTSPDWRSAHDAFHRLSTAGADPQLLRQIGVLRERTHPYLRLAQSSTPESWRYAEARHQAILDGFKANDPDAAVIAMVEHLAATAMRVVAEADPGRDLPAVRHAVTMLGGTYAG